MIPQDASNISNTAMMNQMGGQGEESATQVLWGTNINTGDLQNNLKEFLLTFSEEVQNQQTFNQEPYYVNKLKNMAETEDYTLEVDCNHLYTYKSSLYKQLEDYPADVIPIFDLVAL